MSLSSSISPDSLYTSTKNKRVVNDEIIYEDDKDLSIGDITSFKDINFASEEMKKLLRIEYLDDEEYKRAQHEEYNAEKLFPDWILNDQKWIKTKTRSNENRIADIAQSPHRQRTQDQISTLIHWVMSNWEMANTMGIKRCTVVTQAFKYVTAEPEEVIVKENERNFIFYILISGTCQMTRNGQVIGQLTKGRCFGEVTLLGAKDERHVTVKAQTKVEMLCLNKAEYDDFIKDFLGSERRENYHVLRDCPLFANWSRAKIEKLCNCCSRKVFESNDYIFKQGDDPDYLYFVLDGCVQVVKEINIIVKNRWPEGKDKWRSLARRSTRQFPIQDIVKGLYFGELSIIKNTPRSASVIAKSRTVLLCVEKSDFKRMIRNDDRTMAAASERAVKYNDSESALRDSLSKLNSQSHSRVIHSSGGRRSPSASRSPPSSHSNRGMPQFGSRSHSHRYNRDTGPKVYVVDDVRLKHVATSGVVTGGGRDGGGDSTTSSGSTLDAQLMKAAADFTPSVDSPMGTLDFEEERGRGREKSSRMTRMLYDSHSSLSSERIGTPPKRMVAGGDVVGGNGGVTLSRLSSSVHQDSRFSRSNTLNSAPPTPTPASKKRSLLYGASGVSVASEDYATPTPSGTATATNGTSRSLAYMRSNMSSTSAATHSGAGHNSHNNNPNNNNMNMNMNRHVTVGESIGSFHKETGRDIRFARINGEIDVSKFTERFYPPGFSSDSLLLTMTENQDPPADASHIHPEITTSEGGGGGNKGRTGLGDTSTASVTRRKSKSPDRISQSQIRSAAHSPATSTRNIKTASLASQRNNNNNNSTDALPVIGSNRTIPVTRIRRKSENSVKKPSKKSLSYTLRHYQEPLPTATTTSTTTTDHHSIFSSSISSPDKSHVLEKSSSISQSQLLPQSSSQTRLLRSGTLKSLGYNTNEAVADYEQYLRMQSMPATNVKRNNNSNNTHDNNSSIDGNDQDSAGGGENSLCVSIGEEEEYEDQNISRISVSPNRYKLKNNKTKNKVQVGQQDGQQQQQPMGGPPQLRHPPAIDDLTASMSEVSFAPHHPSSFSGKSNYQSPISFHYINASSPDLKVNYTSNTIESPDSGFISRPGSQSQTSPSFMSSFYGRPITPHLILAHSLSTSPPHHHHYHSQPRASTTTTTTSLTSSAGSSSKRETERERGGGGANVSSSRIRSLPHVEGEKDAPPLSYPFNSKCTRSLLASEAGHRSLLDKAIITYAEIMNNTP